MKFDRSRLKSGFSLAAMIICMSLLASVVGYFLGSWMIQYVTAPDDKIENVSSEKVVQEETIDTNQNEDKNQGQNNATTENNTASTLPNQTQTKQDLNQNLFVVQVGAFDNHNNAKGLVKKLRAKGYSAYITSENPYKVQVGAFESRQAATEMEQKLKKDGFPVFIDH